MIDDRYVGDPAIEMVGEEDYGPIPLGIRHDVKTVLITGVAGLLGSRLADWIHENHPDVNIIGIDDLSGGYIENIGDFVEFYDSDLSVDDNPYNVEVLVDRHEVDVVFHFAAYAAECLSPFIRKYNYRNNLVATANVINACIKNKVKRLVFASSMAVYGNALVPFEEIQTPQPTDPYGVAKYACEMDIQIAGEQHGLDWCIIRPHNVYGAKQNIWDAYRNFIGICMYKVLKGDPLTIYGDGQQKRAFSYIDDSLAPLWAAGCCESANKQIINLGGIHEHTILETAEIIVNVATEMKATGLWHRAWTEPQIIHLPPRHEVRNAWSTYYKSEEMLGFKHVTDLEDGVMKMWMWVLQQPARNRQTFGDYEIDDGIYAYWKEDALKDGYWRDKTHRSIIAGDGVLVGDREVIKKELTVAAAAKNAMVESDRKRRDQRRKEEGEGSVHPVMGDQQAIRDVMKQGSYKGHFTQGFIGQNAFTMDDLLGLEIDETEIIKIFKTIDPLKRVEVNAGFYESDAERVIAEQDIDKKLEAAKEMFDNQVLPMLTPVGATLAKEVKTAILEQKYAKGSPEHEKLLWIETLIEDVCLK